MQKPPSASAGSGILPAIGTALAGAAVGAGIAAAIGGEEENNRESGVSKNGDKDGCGCGGESESQMVKIRIIMVNCFCQYFVSKIEFSNSKF